MELPILKRKQAFTLIELMISVTIITIVTAGIVPAFSKYIRGQNLKQAQEQLKSDLRSLQNKALTGALSDQSVSTIPMKYWAVRFNNGESNYDIFISAVDTGCPGSYAEGQFQVSEKLPSNIVVSSATECIFFDISNGDASGYVGADPHAITIGDGTETKNVYVNKAGLVYTTNE